MSFFGTIRKVFLYSIIYRAIFGSDSSRRTPRRDCGSPDGFHGVDDCRDDYDYDYDRGYESGLGFREELDEEFDYDDTPGYYDRFGSGFDSDGFDDGFADGFDHDDDR